MNISSSHIRAARGWLNWTQQDLANESGVSKGTVRNFEIGTSVPERGTLEAFVGAFARYGVVITETGIERRSATVDVVSTYEAVLDDIERTGGEILFHCADDRRSSPEIAKRLLALYRSERVRSTICAGDRYVLGDPRFYRWVPADYFAGSDVVAVYGNAVAFDLDEKFMIVRSIRLADLWRRQFDYWWKTGGCVVDPRPL